MRIGHESQASVRQHARRHVPLGLYHHPRMSYEACTPWSPPICAQQPMEHVRGQGNHRRHAGFMCAVHLARMHESLSVRNDGLMASNMRSVMPSPNSGHHLNSEQRAEEW